MLKRTIADNSDVKFMVDDLGCWADSKGRVMQTLEDQHAALIDHYKTRTEAFEKCLRAALDFGIVKDMFLLKLCYLWKVEPKRLNIMNRSIVPNETLIF